MICFVNKKFEGNRRVWTQADEMRNLYRLIMQNCQQQIFKYSLMHETNQLLNKPTYCEKCYKKYYCRIQNTDWLNFWQIIPASLFTDLRKLKMTMKKYRFVYKKHHFSRVFGCYCYGWGKLSQEILEFLRLEAKCHFTKY